MVVGNWFSFLKICTTCLKDSVDCIDDTYASTHSPIKNSQLMTIPEDCESIKSIFRFEQITISRRRSNSNNLLKPASDFYSFINSSKSINNNNGKSVYIEEMHFSSPQRRKNVYS